jgi:hypothetical protein
MKNRFLSASLLILTAWGCKPKATSSLDSITGVNAAGEESALSLIPVRNFSASDLSGGDAGAKQAAAMVKTRLFALVECVAAKHKRTDKTISATDLMAAVELRAAIDDLYVDHNRALLTSASDNALADYGSKNKLIAVPCHIHGERLLSWAVITDLQLRASGLPRSLPTNASAKALTMSTYAIVQATHQAFRGSYTEDPAKDFMPRIPALLDMIQEQAGHTTTAQTQRQRLCLHAGSRTSGHVLVPGRRAIWQGLRSREEPSLDGNRSLPCLGLCTLEQRRPGAVRPLGDSDLDQEMGHLFG